MYCLHANDRRSFDLYQSNIALPELRQYTLVITYTLQGRVVIFILLLLNIILSKFNKP